MLLPQFSNSTLFPPFALCPLSTASTPGTHVLLGTISENMTVSTNPTFICKDCAGASFALTLKLADDIRKDGVLGGGYDVTGFRKGWTVIVRGARRSGVKDGKQGFVEVEVDANGAGGLEVIPTSVEKLLEMSRLELPAGQNETGEEGIQSCQACGTQQGAEKLSRCKGCESVWYCNKECQTRGWSEKGHKAECKVYKAVRIIFSKGSSVE